MSKAELLIALAFLQYSDIVSTLLGNSVGLKEANPLMANSGQPDFVLIVATKSVLLFVTALLVSRSAKPQRVKYACYAYVCLIAWNLSNSFIQVM